MNFSCIICSDLIAPSAEIFATQCGHLFHHPCLMQWIERSKTCPQCRFKATEKTIHRVYFNLANTDNLDDAAVLQNKLDNLQFQLNLKEKDIKAFKEKYKKYKVLNVQLRDEVIVLEEKQRTNNSVQLGLQDQVKFFRSQVKEKDRLAEEVSQLRTKLKNIESVQTVIEGSRDEVNNMLRNESDVESLALLAVTLKKTLLDTERKKMNSDHKSKILQNELNRYKKDYLHLETTYEDLKKEFDSSKTTWAKEKQFLTDVVNGINKDTPTRHKINSAIPLKRILSESPMPLPTRPILNNSCTDIIDFNETPTTPATLEDQVLEILDSNSPYLPVKTNSLGINLTFNTVKIKPTSAPETRKIMSIFKPTSRQLESLRSTSKNSDNLVYNGLGGQSKEDIFPSPKKSSLAGIKRHKTSTITSAKFRKLTPNAKK